MAEKTGEVVRNHGVGTGSRVWLTQDRRRGDALGVDAREHVDEGENGSVGARADSDVRTGAALDESQER
jgi:hypothetical protein